jgi:hypothetical protein
MKLRELQEKIDNFNDKADLIYNQKRKLTREVLPYAIEFKDCIVNEFKDIEQQQDCKTKENVKSVLGGRISTLSFLVSYMDWSLIYDKDLLAFAFKLQELKKNEMDTTLEKTFEFKFFCEHYIDSYEFFRSVLEYGKKLRI